MDFANINTIQFLYLPVPISREITLGTLDNFNYLLPLTMDLRKWGDLIKITEFERYYKNNNSCYCIKFYNSKHFVINEVLLLNKSFNKENIIDFIDYREYNDNNNTFLRKVNNNILHYIDGTLISHIKITYPTIRSTNSN